jgi:hypothetical protein
MRNSLSGWRGKPPWKPSGRPLATPAMLPAKLGSEKADKSSVDRSTKDALADLPRRYLRIALTGIVPVFRRKWDQRFESAFLQRRVCKLSVPVCSGRNWSDDLQAQRPSQCAG